MLWDRISADQWDTAQGFAVKLGLHLTGIELREPPYDYERALAEAPANSRKFVCVGVAVLLSRSRQAR